MSLSAVTSKLSDLKKCQTDIGTGMDIVTEVALDLVEIEGSEEDLKKLEQMMLDCARLDREITCFVEAVEQITTEARQQPPEAMFTLKNRVRECFAELEGSLSESDLQRHKKVVSYRESLQNAQKLANPSAAASTDDELDEDIVVTQSQQKLTCPLTLLEMVNPVRNKKCNHHYDHDAVLDMIRRNESQKKKSRCPVVGCSNTDVKQSDLVADVAMKRMIQKKQGPRT
ncbi:E3 SUMO-protein ligase NSE2 [Megalops cyprinoides]|uniref:E3 SUMO-protein ligase NSE2 n=1 Tax=Megalops cyprinoides TaxID=118141 RepID=UPI0018656A72|nr:E3 SUMO-protein ligase NSE2 [Megalops cyprinoides]